MTQPVNSIGLLYASILPENERNFLKRNDLVLTVRHDQIIIYKGRDSSYHAKKRDPISDLNLLKRSYQGILGKSAIKQISKQVTLWADSIDYYNTRLKLHGKKKRRQLVFLTVTLQSDQAHTDKEIKRKILMPFIDSLKYHFNITNYFWRAEAQKNNNIHFHLILDKYIPYEKAKYLWNQACEKLGYITRFAEKNGHFYPNSVDIRVINNTKNTIKYVLKYATKQGDTRAINGRLWGMADNIRMLKTPSFFQIDEYIEPILKYIHCYSINPYFEEHFMTIKTVSPVVKEFSRTALGAKLKDHYLKIYSFLYLEDSPFDTDPALTIYQGLDYEEIKSISKII